MVDSETQLCRTYKGLQGAQPGTPGQTPSLFDMCTGFFYMRYTTHETNGFTSHPKDAAMVKCLAYKDTSVMAGDLNLHFADQKQQSLNLVTTLQLYNILCVGHFVCIDLLHMRHTRRLMPRSPCTWAVRFTCINAVSPKMPTSLHNAQHTLCIELYI